MFYGYNQTAILSCSTLCWNAPTIPEGMTSCCGADADSRCPSEHAGWFACAALWLLVHGQPFRLFPVMRSRYMLSFTNSLHSFHRFDISPHALQRPQCLPQLHHLLSLPPKLAQYRRLLLHCQFPFQRGTAAIGLLITTALHLDICWTRRMT